MLSELRIETEKLVDAETCDQERHCKSGGIKCRKHQTALPTAGGCCQGHDSAEDRADARSPTGRKGNAQRQRSQHAPRLLVGKPPRVSVQVLNLEQSDQVQ